MASWLRERSTESITRIADNIIEPLLTLMDDEEEDIRTQAMVMAATMKDERIVPHARAMFLSDADWWVRSVAADALSNFASADVIEVLVGKIGDQDVGLSAISALGKCGDESAIPHLITPLQDARPSARIEALNALKQFPRQDVIEGIKRMVSREDHRRVLEHAALVVKAMGVQEDFVNSALENIERSAGSPSSEEEFLFLEMENQNLNPEGSSPA